MENRKFPSHYICGSNFKPTIIFVTVCAKHKKYIFNNHKFMSAAVNGWNLLKDWIVGVYVIMPDHIHFTVTPSRDACALRKWIKSWKIIVSKELMAKGIWQRDYWDRTLRSENDYGAMVDYIYQNPVRAGLVKNESDWEFKGQVVNFSWRF